MWRLQLRLRLQLQQWSMGLLMTVPMDVWQIRRQMQSFRRVSRLQMLV
jgi:hypothetical protein